MIGTAGAYYGVDNSLHIVVLGQERAAGLMHQFLNYVGIVLGQGLAHLGACVTRGYTCKHRNHLHQGHFVPLIKVAVFGL